MKERPILFSAQMVRAILDGRKTQTRRVVKPQPHRWIAYFILLGASGPWKPVWGSESAGDEDEIVEHNRCIKCPYGVPGDRLWVRETCRAEQLRSGKDGVRFAADNAWRPIANTEQAAGRWIDLRWYRVNLPDDPTNPGVWVPPIHMPRWASRIDLEITAVRVERVGDISTKDCEAEGMDWDGPCGLNVVLEKYMDLWDSINAKRGAGWDTNPWVWVIEFRRIKP